MAFILYGVTGTVYPVLVLHLILLPLNIVRLQQLRRLVRDLRDASTGEFSIDWLKPFTRRRTQTVVCEEDGTLLLITYDEARQLYFQNPKFGFYFLQLAAERLTRDAQHAAAQPA